MVEKRWIIRLAKYYIIGLVYEFVLCYLEIKGTVFVFAVMLYCLIINLINTGTYTKEAYLINDEIGDMVKKYLYTFTDFKFTWELLYARTENMHLKKFQIYYYIFLFGFIEFLIIITPWAYKYLNGLAQLIR